MTKTNPTPKRRWFRFSLRTLLIVVVLLSLPLGWCALKIRQAERQRRVVVAIREAGGLVTYGGAIDESEKPPMILKSLDSAGIRFGRDLCADIFAVQLQGCMKGHCALLKDVKGLTSLSLLNLSGTPVTDVGLENLKGLTNLSVLDLSDTPVTDVGLENLKGLTKLSFLDLSGTQVTEGGIEELQKILPNCVIEWDDPPNNKPEDQP